LLTYEIVEGRMGILANDFNLGEDGELDTVVADSKLVHLLALVWLLLTKLVAWEGQYLEAVVVA